MNTDSSDHQNKVYACNCPNNCRHKVGTGCKYYAGPSDTSGVIEGSKFFFVLSFFFFFFFFFLQGSSLNF